MSQASQDLFVLHMTKFKKGGSFLEIGSNYILQKIMVWRLELNLAVKQVKYF
jgi:hypothetical protein